MPELKRCSEIPETLGNVFFYTLTYKVKNGTVFLSICKCLKMLHHSSERLLQCLNADEGSRVGALPWRWVQHGRAEVEAYTTNCQRPIKAERYIPKCFNHHLPA